jgi:double-stranded uracil-DNA glycosylase
VDRRHRPRAPRKARGPRPRRLADRIGARPRILFVGINPSLRSAEVGHHFAGPGNPFWRLLAAAGLVPEGFGFAADRGLPALGLGLTNIVPRATRAAAELAPAEYAAGRRLLARKIGRARPAVVAFVGVTVYRRYFGSGAAGGSGPKPDRIGEARVFVVPNPSGRNAAYPGFEDKLVWYRRLADYAAEARSASRRAARSREIDLPRRGLCGFLRRAQGSLEPIQSRKQNVDAESGEEGQCHRN